MNRPLFAGDPEVRIPGYGKNKYGNRNSPEVRDRAVWVVFEHQSEFDSQSAAIKSVAPKIGCGPDTLRAGFDAQKRTAFDVMV